MAERARPGDRQRKSFNSRVGSRGRLMPNLAISAIIDSFLPEFRFIKRDPNAKTRSGKKGRAAASHILIPVILTVFHNLKSVILANYHKKSSLVISFYTKKRKKAISGFICK